MESARLKSSVRDLKSSNLWKSLIAECLGTFILVYIGSHSGPFKVNSLKVGVGFGFGGLVAIFCIGNISGGHINPAVSFALLVARQISLVRFVLYFFVQVLGALVAAKLSSFSNIYKTNSTNITKKATPVSESNVELFVCEIVITFFLVFTVMRLCVEKSRSDKEKALAPFVIGIAIMLGVLSGGEIGGGSMNPAASIGLAYGDKRLWIFIVGPLIGGTIAALLQQLVFSSELSKEFVKEYFCSATFGQCDTPKEDKSKPQVQLQTDDKHIETKA